MTEYCKNSLPVVRTSSPPPSAAYRDWSPIWSDYHSLASHHQIKPAKAAWFDCFGRRLSLCASTLHIIKSNCLLIKGADERKNARFVLNDMGGKVLMEVIQARFMLSTCNWLPSTTALVYSLPFLKIAAFAHFKALMQFKRKKCSKVDPKMR